MFFEPKIKKDSFVKVYFTFNIIFYDRTFFIFFYFVFYLIGLFSNSISIFDTNPDVFLALFFYFA